LLLDDDPAVRRLRAGDAQEQRSEHNESNDENRALSH
jgi:hypothetical protein